MTKQHFQTQVKLLAEADEFNFSLLELIKEKHESLIKTDKYYLKSNEHHFLNEIFSTTPDIEVRNYFRHQLTYEIQDWDQSIIAKIKRWLND